MRKKFGKYNLFIVSLQRQSRKTINGRYRLGILAVKDNELLNYRVIELLKY